MKRVVSLILVLAIVVSILAIVPAASAAKKKKDTHYYVCTDNGLPLKLRESPSTKAKVLLKIPFGDEFVVFEMLKNGWTYGHWGGEFGYVMTRFLSNKKPTVKPTPKPTQKPSEAETELNKLNAELKSETAVDPYYISVRAPRATSWVNFRVGPGKLTSRISTLADGKELKVVGETTHWFKAEDPDTGKTGYLYKDYAIEAQKPVVIPLEAETDGKKQLGTLNINGAFALQCEIPDGYEIQVVNMMGSKIIASILSQDITKPQLYLSVAFDETYAEVDRMNDLSAEDLAVLENSFREMNEVEISYRETAYGTKLLVARETGADTDFVSIVSVYKGYLVEFNMTPSTKTATQQLTDEQIRMCIDFLTNLDFVPVTE